MSLIAYSCGVMFIGRNRPAAVPASAPFDSFRSRTTRRGGTRARKRYRAASWPAALDCLDAVLLDVSGDDAGERAAQVGRKLMHGLSAIERERAHRLVRDLEGPLELRPYGEQPVEVVGIAALAAELTHGLDAVQ